MSFQEADIEEDTIYIFTLGRLKGVGPETLRFLVSSFPTKEDLQHASVEALETHLRPSLAALISEQVHQQPGVWRRLREEAQTLFSHHIEQNITPIPITNPMYPPLLKKIPDPPVILYAKGDLRLLHQTNTVAIVGTRAPTDSGKNVARHLARYFAQLQYCVVSGLAKGIDTAAHEGVVEAGGKTIAVFGTPLDVVYPAENKSLAQHIVETGGLLISELPVGSRGFRSAFVRRDRIQSGLSLAVIPVQTSEEGGTMHTIKFARMQSRLVACPIPLKQEAYAAQYRGIFALLRETNAQAYAFRASTIGDSDILERLQAIRNHLLSQEELQQAFVTFMKAYLSQATSMADHSQRPVAEKQQLSEGGEGQEAPEASGNDTAASSTLSAEEQVRQESRELPSIPAPESSPSRSEPQANQREDEAVPEPESAPSKKRRVRKEKASSQETSPRQSYAASDEADTKTRPRRRVAESPASYQSSGCIQNALW